MTNCNATITTHCAMPVGHDPEIHISSVEPADLHTARAEIGRLREYTDRLLDQVTDADRVNAGLVERVARAEAALKEHQIGGKKNQLVAATLLRLQARLDAVRAAVERLIAATQTALNGGIDDWDVARTLRREWLRAEKALAESEGE